MWNISFLKKSISTLIIGDLVHNERALCALAKQVCKTLHVSTVSEEILSITLQERIDLIFGTFIYNDVSYLETLQRIRKANAAIEIVLFFPQMCQTMYIDEINALTCYRYFCMASEAHNILKHFKDAIDSLSTKIFF